MLNSVYGCSTPRTLLLFSSTCSCNSSASFSRLKAWYVAVKNSMLHNLSGCSAPKNFTDFSSTCTCISSALLNCHKYQYASAKILMSASILCSPPKLSNYNFTFCSIISLASSYLPLLINTHAKERIVDNMGSYSLSQYQNFLKQLLGLKFNSVRKFCGRKSQCSFLPLELLIVHF